MDKKTGIPTIGATKKKKPLQLTSEEKEAALGLRDFFIDIGFLGRDKDGILRVRKFSLRVLALICKEDEKKRKKAEKKEKKKEKK